MTTPLTTLEREQLEMVLDKHSMTLHVTKTALGNAPAVEIQTLNQASALYRAFLRRNNLGAREAGQALIKHQGKVVAHVGFNGTVWAGRRWFSGAKPIFDPRTI